MVMIICIVDDGDNVDAEVIFPEDDGDDSDVYQDCKRLRLRWTSTFCFAAMQ